MGFFQIELFRDFKEIVTSLDDLLLRTPHIEILRTIF